MWLYGDIIPIRIRSSRAYWSMGLVLSLSPMLWSGMPRTWSMMWINPFVAPKVTKHVTCLVYKLLFSCKYKKYLGVPKSGSKIEAFTPPPSKWIVRFPSHSSRKLKSTFRPRVTVGTWNGIRCKLQKMHRTQILTWPSAISSHCFTLLCEFLIMSEEEMGALKMCVRRMSMSAVTLFLRTSRSTDFSIAYL
jgi:hypothetical protein